MQSQTIHLFWSNCHIKIFINQTHKVFETLWVFTKTFMLSSYLFLGAFLFCLGLVVSITKKNVIMVLIGLELMLNAANINLVAFSKYDTQLIQGQMFTLFVIVVAAAETAVALAIAFKVYQYFQTPELDKISEIGDR
jgi:NADH:ubiquinone oxidoreductase subunit K